jgi:hypothetical protein
MEVAARVLYATPGMGMGLGFAFATAEEAANILQWAGEQAGEVD